MQGLVGWMDRLDLVVDLLMPSLETRTIRLTARVSLDEEQDADDNDDNDDGESEDRERRHKRQDELSIRYVIPNYL